MVLYKSRRLAQYDCAIGHQPTRGYIRKRLDVGSLAIRRVNQSSRWPTITLP